MPLFPQNCVLIRVLIDRSAVRMFYEGDELQEQPLPSHSQLFAKVLTGCVVILGVSVDSSGSLFPEQVVKKSVSGFVGVPPCHGRLC